MIRQFYITITGLAFIFSLWMIFLWAPTEINQGLIAPTTPLG